MSSVMRFDEWQDSDGNPVASGVGGFSAPGSILQVVEGTTTIPVTISTTTLTSTGLSASITPSSTTSKILVLVNQKIRILRSGGSAGAEFQLFRGGTLISDTERIVMFNNSGADQTGLDYMANINKLDSPGSASLITYETKAATTSSESTVSPQQANGRSTITLIEVAG